MFKRTNAPLAAGMGDKFHGQHFEKRGYNLFTAVITIIVVILREKTQSSEENSPSTKVDGIVDN